MSRCRSWVAVFLFSLILTLNATEAGGCELLLRQRDASEGPGFFVYLLMAEKAHFQESVIDYTADSSTPAFKKFRDAVNASSRECHPAYFGNIEDVTDDRLLDFLFHFRNTTSFQEDTVFEFDDVIYWDKDSGSTLSAFVGNNEEYKGWAKFVEVWEYNYPAINVEKAGGQSVRLRLQRNQRQVRLILLKPEDLPDADEQGFFAASSLLEKLAARGVSVPNLDALAVKKTEVVPPPPPPSPPTGETWLVVWKERLLGLRKWHVGLAALLFGLVVGALLTHIARAGFRWRQGVQYAQGARFRALAKKLDPKRSISNVGDAEIFFEDQTNLLLELASSLNKMSQGQEVKPDQLAQGQLSQGQHRLATPEGLSIREWVTRLIDQLRQQLKSQEEKTWKAVNAALVEHNEQLGLQGQGSDPAAMKGEKAFKRLLALSGNVLERLRTELEQVSGAGKGGNLVEGFKTYVATAQGRIKEHETTAKRRGHDLDTLRKWLKKPSEQGSENLPAGRLPHDLISSIAPKLEEKKVLEDLLNRQDGPPKQGSLDERFDAYLKNYVGSLKGAISDLTDFLETSGKGTSEEPPASLQNLQKHAVKAAPVKPLLERALTTHQNRVAEHRRQADLVAALRKASTHLSEYYRVAGVLRTEKRETVASGASHDLAAQLVNELVDLKSSAESQRKERFIIDILRVAMVASLHLNQAVSIWKSTGDTTITLQLLASGHEKLNLYALALLEGRDLKPVAAAELLIGDDDHPGQLTALLRILAVIGTLHVYVEVWRGLPGDVRDGLENVDKYLRHLLDQLGIEAHDPEPLGDPGALGIEYRTEKSLIVLEEDPFKRELASLTRNQPWTSSEIVVELKQLGFNVNPQGLSSLKIRQWPSFLCVAKSSQLERYAREYK